MVVVYRLQGLDGEATEEIVDSLEQEEDEDVDPEVKFGITDVVGEGTGFDVLLRYVQQVCCLLLWPPPACCCHPRLVAGFAMGVR